MDVSLWRRGIARKPSAPPRRRKNTKERARFVTAASLINELVEAQQHNLISLALQRWARYDLIVLDEVGYVPFAQVGAELLFQAISERA